MKVRIRFSKTGNMRYIGHLDVLRYFQKAFSRAGIDVKYSEGFHPHPVMSFASPLSVGLTSEGEYLDAEFLSAESSRDCIRRLNAVMSEGMKVLQVRKLPDDKKKAGNAMALVGRAAYRATLRNPEAAGLSREIWISQAQHFMAQREIPVQPSPKKQNRKSGRGSRKEGGESAPETVNIRPWILDFKASGEGSFTMLLSAGSSANLKPETVMESFLLYCKSENLILKKEDGTSARDLWLLIHRLDLFTEEGTSLGNLGEDF